MSSEDVLLLILIANGSPILACRLAGDREAVPVDFGCRGWDGQPLFGLSKTWRGIASALLMTGLAAMLLGGSFVMGALLALAAMLGDLFSSFIKRRLGLAPSSRCWGLDQVPEALLPALLAAWLVGLSGWAVAGIVLAFLLLSTLLSRALFLLGVRKHPY